VPPTERKSAIQPGKIPVDSFLHTYKQGSGYADCYVTEVPGVITQATFIESFYTTPLFKLERTILKYLASKPATHADAKQLALGNASTFSAWRVESRSTSELLLADFTGGTRSWLMTVASIDARTGAPSTLLYFGSAVVARKRSSDGQLRMGWVFHALLGFHRVYSRLLLKAASRRVRATLST
jgi:hypothetical protein